VREMTFVNTNQCESFGIRRCNSFNIHIVYTKFICNPLTNIFTLFLDRHNSIRERTWSFSDWISSDVKLIKPSCVIILCHMLQSILYVSNFIQFFCIFVLTNERIARIHFHFSFIVYYFSFFFLCTILWFTKIMN